MCAIPEERACQAARAVHTLTRWLRNQALDATLDTHAEAPVATVVIRNAHDKPLATGSGKGEWAVAGAYFEALEHLLLTHHFIATRVDIQPLSTWLASAQCHPDCLFRAVLEEYPDGLLQFAYYRSHFTTRSYWIPQVLCDPFSPEPLLESDATRFLRQYSSNSGWAAGSTFEEALLHGANELIERHYLGALYQQLIGYTANSGQFWQLQPPSDLVHRYQTHLPTPEGLTVVGCKTRYGSHFCVCVLANPSQPMAWRGAGVSYSEYHAIERALSELVQSIENSDDQIRQSDQRTALWLRRYPKLLPLIDLAELSQLPCRDRRALAPTPMTFEQHYTKLERALTLADQDLLVHTAFHDEGLWLVSTFMPGLERFNIIDKGIWVVPLAKQACLAC